MRQKTINSECSLWGVSLHHNKTVKLTFLPARADTGIYFQYASQKIAVGPGSLLKSGRKFTTLSNGLVSIECVEHVLAAISGLGITNLGVVLEYDNEPPWMDGSAWPFVRQLLAAGLRDQTSYEPLWPEERIFLQAETSESYIKVFPDSNFTVDCTIDFPNLIGRQRYIHRSTAVNFIMNICRARSFIPYPICGNEDKTLARLPGFVLDGARSNVIVYNKGDFLTPLRFKDEPVRHKILDFIGDIAVLGRPVSGYFVLYKPSHELNGLLVRKLCEIFEKNQILSANTFPFNVSGRLAGS